MPRDLPLAGELPLAPEGLPGDLAHIARPALDDVFKDSEVRVIRIAQRLGTGTHVTARRRLQSRGPNYVHCMSDLFGGRTIPGIQIPLIAVFEIIGKLPKDLDLGVTRIEAVAECTHVTRLFSECRKCDPRAKSITADLKRNPAHSRDLYLAKHVSHPKQSLDKVGLTLSNV